jgi:hypothetical protein
VRITFTVPNASDGPAYLTPEAVASMVGQAPRLTRDYDWTKPMGHVTVIAASVDGDTIRMTIETDGNHDDKVRALLGIPDVEAFSLGRAVPVLPGGCGFQRAVYPDHERSVRLHEVGPVTPPVVVNTDG